MAPNVATRARALRRRVGDSARRERIALLRRLPVRPDTVCYESFAGNGALCNPEAIFRGLLATPDLGHLRHVWILDDPARHRSIVAEFAGDPRVSFVRRGSAAHDRAQTTAKYLINNATFPSTFAKRDGQVYLNTWHGTPLKAMGYDVPGGALATCNVVRNLISCDYLLAPNDDTERMYLDAYRARNLFRGKLIKAGTPRVDRQFTDEIGKAAIRARLRAAGVELREGQQVLLYAPTWRGDFYHPDDDVRELRERVETLRARIDTERYCVLLKVHQQVYRFAERERTLQRLLVPNDVPTNDVLAVTDLLVTDYSSIFIDFLATGRPVVFLAPDLEQYASTRALNLPPERWPGPLCRDLDELVHVIKQVGTGTDADPVVSHAAAYAAAQERYCPREDGHATERVIDIVFRGRAGSPDVAPAARDGRTTLLIYIGGMVPNGISASALSLLENIDYQRFDVSAFFAETTRRERRALIAQINPNVRLLSRPGGLLASPFVARAIRFGGWWGGRPHRPAARRHQRVLRDEWVRCFGAARFDHVIDFSGYSPFWDKILVQSGSPSFSIWLHNDLKADADRRVGGKHPHRKNLYGVFEFYRYAQNLVSVSSALNTINRQSLSRFAGAARFTYARNTINHERILHLAHAPGAQAVTPAPGSKTFVTVGRLSPEKNHERLLRAFAEVHRDDPETRLLIVGNGPLLDDLRRLTEQLGLGGAVTLTGHLPNPYRVMGQCGCFVLSSDYEGQPMVLLEALVLGLPVVSTAFASVSDALPEGTGRVVQPSVEALAEGMRAYLRGEVPAAAFDPAVYNQQAMIEFYRAIGAPADAG